VILNKRQVELWRDINLDLFSQKHKNKEEDLGKPSLNLI
jgi:hypothetical protein